MYNVKLFSWISVCLFVPDMEMVNEIESWPDPTRPTKIADPVTQFRQWFVGVGRSDYNNKLYSPKSVAHTYTITKNS